MTTLQGFFRAAADLIAGQLPGPGFGTPFSFYDNLPPNVPIERLRAFSQVPEPSSRLCCAIGWRQSQAILPEFTGTQPMGLGSLGHNSHRYGGPTGYSPGALTQVISIDPVGHFYTARGGIVDIGHVRDHADLARYLATQVRMGIQNGWILELTAEAGTRRIHFLPQGYLPDPRLCALLGAHLSYEISIWHEIVTWASTAKLEHQPYSAFSPEDNFSNLLGAYLGFRATLEPDTDFDTAMSRHLLNALFILGAVSRIDAEVAVNYIEERWFTYQAGNLVLLRRHFDALPTVTPWLIQAINIQSKQALLEQLRKVTGNAILPIALSVPDVGPQGEPLSSYYTFEISVNTNSIPLTFLNPLPTTLTPAHFPALIDKVRAAVLAMQPEGDRP